MSMLTGLAAMRERQSEIDEAVAGFGTFVPKLFLKDGESAKVRFITDFETAVVSGDFHSMPQVSKTGRRWWKMFACTKDSGACEHCDAGNSPGFRFGMWLWVHYVLHTQQKDDGWEAVVVGQTTLFKEEVDGPMLFSQGWRVSCTLTAYFDKRGTLSDRDYDVSRKGKSQNTTYTFDPDDPSVFNEDIPELPPIWGAMLDEVMMDGTSQAAFKTTVAAKKEEVAAAPVKAAAGIQDVNALLAQLSSLDTFFDEEEED